MPKSRENPGGTEGYCQDVCAGSLTEEQMSCLEGKSCTQLAGASVTSLCPPPKSTTSSSSGSSGSPKKKGDSCTCDPDGSEKGVYKACTGNASACFDIDLSCLAEAATGKGTCVVTCSEPGKACPSGGTCGTSGRKGIDGEPWSICQ